MLNLTLRSTSKYRYDIMYVSMNVSLFRGYFILFK